MDNIKIIDEHTDKPISRQRKWQLRQREKDCCEICGKPSEEVFENQRLCEEHILKKAGYAKQEKQ